MRHRKSRIDLFPKITRLWKARTFCWTKKCGKHLRDNIYATEWLMLTIASRFLNCQGGKKVPGKSLLEVGVDASLADAGWEPETFIERGGIFEWERAHPNGLEW
jgi:hypothetical protein